MSFSLSFSIAAPDRALVPSLQSVIDHKTKPLGSLGVLEELALRVCLVQQTAQPVLHKPHLVIFAADHGVVEEGVSAYPQGVTAQMVLNYVRGGAAVNVFARQHSLSLMIVDAGVKGVIPVPSDLLGELMHAKVAHGTRNLAREAAMSEDECLKAVETGASIVRDLHDDGVNVVGFGEMGIGNTTAAAAIMSLLCGEPLERCAGRGAGLTDEQVQHKITILQLAMELHKPHCATPLDVLRRVGGLEIAMMCGAALQAAELGMLVLVDGFIATSAILVAAELYPAMLEYCVFSHLSDEKGHALMLKRLSAKPLLQLSMRLGEGTGVALAYPLVQAAVGMMNDMATFASAGVSGKNKSVKKNL